MFICMPGAVNEGICFIALANLQALVTFKLGFVSTAFNSPAKVSAYALIPVSLPGELVQF